MKELGEVIPYLVYVVCIMLPACRCSTIVKGKAKHSFCDCWELGRSPRLPTMPGGLDADGVRGPPLFMASGASHDLCSGKAEAFDVPLLYLGADSELSLRLFLMA
jgi:hypothetical protein